MHVQLLVAKFKKKKISKGFFSSAWLMSAELMKSKFVRRPCRNYISEPNARISFKFHLWLLLDYLQRQFFSFFLFIFYEYISFSLTWDPIGVKISKHYSLLPQLCFIFNQTFSKYALWQSSQELLLGIVKFLEFNVLQIGRQQVSHVDYRYVLYLGILLDDQLNWKSHINHLWKPSKNSTR